MRVNRDYAGIGCGADVGGCRVRVVCVAADMPVKAPPPPPPPCVLDVHGFVDFTFKNDYITPRGLLVYDQFGLTTQIYAAWSLDVYKDKNGFINNFIVFGGMWNELWSKQNDLRALRHLERDRLVRRHRASDSPRTGNSASSTSNSCFPGDGTALNDDLRAVL